MANVSYLRSPVGGRASGRQRRGSTTSHGRSRGRGRYVVGGALLIVVGVIVAGALILSSARASLAADPSAVARVSLPMGGGTIQSATLYTGPGSVQTPVAGTTSVVRHVVQIPVAVRGDKIWPLKRIAAGRHISLDVIVKRPGWIAWLAGSTQHLHLTLTTPVASLRSHYVTVPAHAPLLLHFRQPIQVYAFGQSPDHMKRYVLAAPASVVRLPRSAAAGSVFVSAAPRSWESSRTAVVSWFPSGGAATAIASPAPGTQIQSGTPITLTFSKTVSQVLGSHLPPVSPNTAGDWQRLNSHAIVFRPRGYGYGLAADVSIPLPSGVKLVGARPGANGGSWTVPGGSTVRVQQILALLGYLPLDFKYAGPGVGLTVAAQEAAAINPPAGRFTWRYANTPAVLRGFWQVGASGTVTRGALMAFENDHGMTADGVAGPLVWKALIDAVLTDHRSTFGYTFVSVSVASQSLTLWHNGRTVIAGTPVNTGIAAAPTATGTYPVYEHLPVTTMSGTNPDGSHYSDPGIPDVSYFNGGDALHGFTRAQYGSPQSLGCVEMPYSVAAQVYPYTPIGTLVHVA